MALVTYKTLRIDANDRGPMRDFWSRTLGFEAQTFDGGEVLLRGEGPAAQAWITLVDEPRNAKNRVHLDVWATSLDPFAGCERVTAEGEHPWTTMRDPEGGEFCVFLTDDAAKAGLKDIVVDSVDHAAIGAWWAELLGATPVEDGGYTYVEGVPGAPFESMDFVPVPEPKTVKNRVHWDVSLAPGATVEDVLAAGATLLRARGDDLGWDVLADPEGNEFCVFDAPGADSPA